MTTNAYATVERERAIRADLERRLRELVRDTAGLPLDEALAAERAMLLARVNRHRAQAGLAPVTEDLIRQIQEQAHGHSDYVLKVVLHSADLAAGHELPWTSRAV
ncbi:hypothetical protein [Catenuloplanes atrovinosus]|uniref:Uncharacterized protein n=1 Tax=Catenuloplanes atrovinosus TaxID=137266 RepID=A0AAE3YST7_9ACTN|nr:hypothetical protein [Catenuloplanes atrovinosus]MDR7277734.1 hypothetical protein [Catenuloplanes atrovinosus]